MIKEKAMELIQALRSGNYKQGKGCLRREDKYCLMGVACDLYDPNLWSSIGSFYHYNGERSLLPKQVIEYYGFHSSTGDLRTEDLIAISDKELFCLTHANDMGITFDQLADYIEQNWHLL